jgi:hypothetical protein
MLTKNEDYCYVCGDNVRQHVKAVAKHRPVSPLTNLVFLASLAFTAYCFFAEHKLSLPATLAVSASLLLIRILAERLANRSGN